jgi:hypothetical protein
MYEEFMILISFLFFPFFSIYTIITFSGLTIANNKFVKTYSLFHYFVRFLCTESQDYSVAFARGI